MQVNMLSPVRFLWIAIMPEKITAEDLISNLVETIAENVPKKKSVSFFEEEEGSVTSRINRLFGRQKSVRHLLGGGKLYGSLFPSLFIYVQ
uniref:Reticulon domain-containing protein n=1 Tax=Salix viminalis TaxID=40686 RepID=A0A6N2KND9_SALVM